MADFLIWRVMRDGLPIISVRPSAFAPSLRIYRIKRVALGQE